MINKILYKVSQIECSSATNPPSGCTKFFWGSGKYVLTNYNYRGDAAVTGNLGIHLANQHERQCIRREKGNCMYENVIYCFMSIVQFVILIIRFVQRY